MPVNLLGASTPALIVLLALSMSACGSSRLDPGSDPVPVIDAPDPPPVDVPPCNCPPVQPPLIFTEATASWTIAALDSSSGTPHCPLGYLAISGSCTTVAMNPPRELRVQGQGTWGLLTSGWECEVRNQEAAPIEFVNHLVCIRITP